MMSSIFPPCLLAIWYLLWRTFNSFVVTKFFFNNQFIYFNWRLITLKHCSGFCYTLTWINNGYTCVPHPVRPSHLPPHPILQGHPSALGLSALSHALNLDWWSISHTVICMFQCYSLKSSHPYLLPQSLKVYTLYLCLFCCLAYRIIISIFLNSIYMRSDITEQLNWTEYCIGVFLSGLLHSI